MSARTTNSAVGSPRTGRARGSALASTGTGESVDPLVAPPLGTMPLTSGPRVDFPGACFAPHASETQQRSGTVASRREPGVRRRAIGSRLAPASLKGSSAAVAIEFHATRHFGRAVARTSSRCWFRLRLSGKGGPSWFRGGSPQRSAAPACTTSLGYAQPTPLAGPVGAAVWRFQHRPGFSRQPQAYPIAGTL